MKKTNRAIEKIQKKSHEVKGEVQRLNKSLSLVFKNSETLKNELKQETLAKFAAEERNQMLEQSLEKKNSEISAYRRKLEELQTKLSVAESQKVLGQSARGCVHTPKLSISENIFGTGNSGEKERSAAWSNRGLSTRSDSKFSLMINPKFNQEQQNVVNRAVVFIDHANENSNEEYFIKEFLSFLKDSLELAPKLQEDKVNQLGLLEGEISESK